MTAPRASKVDLNATPFYHCMSRCVRRSYLCGKDLHTGVDYEHRKGWLVAKIKQLSKIFAIKICAYAIMSNHYHLVLFVNSSQAKNWTDAQVIERWAALFPVDAAKLGNSFIDQKLIDMKVALWRERLMSISWFMRCINEYIAIYSNQEDNCKGRFWEGRFKSQALLDEGAVLAAMAYVDLNPIRAKIASTPEESEFTSIYERIKTVNAETMKKNNTQPVKPSGANPISKMCDRIKQPSYLMAFSNGRPDNGNPKIDFSLSDYLELIDSTGRIIRDDKRGSIPHKMLPILTRLNLTSSGWFQMVENLEQHFFHAIGHSLIMADFCNQFRSRLPKGIRKASQCYQQAA